MSYINVRYDILRQKKLSALDKLVFEFVSGFFEGDCTASNEYIAKTLGVSIRSIQRSIGRLKKMKYMIAINHFENGMMIYRELKCVKYRREW